MTLNRDGRLLDAKTIIGMVVVILSCAGIGALIGWAWSQ